MSHVAESPRASVFEGVSPVASLFAGLGILEGGVILSAYSAVFGGEYRNELLNTFSGVAVFGLILMAFALWEMGKVRKINS